jgi:hypothetical protein
LASLTCFVPGACLSGNRSKNFHPGNFSASLFFGGNKVLKRPSVAGAEKSEIPRQARTRPKTPDERQSIQ